MPILKFLRETDQRNRENSRKLPNSFTRGIRDSQWRNSISTLFFFLFEYLDQARCLKIFNLSSLFKLKCYEFRLFECCW